MSYSVERHSRFMRDPKNQLYCRCFCHWAEGQRDPEKLKTPSHRILTPIRIERTATSCRLVDDDVRFEMCELCQIEATNNPDENNPKSCVNARAHYEPIARDDEEFTHLSKYIYRASE